MFDLIMSIDVNGDRDLMTLDEAMQEIYDIALTDNQGFMDYKEENPYATLNTYAKGIKREIIKRLKRNCQSSFRGVTYVRVFVNDDILRNAILKLKDDLKDFMNE